MRTKKHLHRSQSTKSPSLAEYLSQANERTFRDVNPTCVVALVSESTRKIATDNEKLAGYLVGMAREEAGSRCICHQSCKAQGGLPQAHGTRHFPHRCRRSCPAGRKPVTRSPYTSAISDNSRPSLLPSTSRISMQSSLYRKRPSSSIEWRTQDKFFSDCAETTVHTSTHMNWLRTCSTATSGGKKTANLIVGGSK